MHIFLEIKEETKKLLRCSSELSKILNIKVHWKKELKLFATWSNKVQVLKLTKYISLCCNELVFKLINLLVPDNALTSSFLNYNRLLNGSNKEVFNIGYVLRV